MTRILLTGGAGYIGSILSEVLLEQGYTLDIVDNFFFHQSSLNHLCNRDSLTIHKLDIRDKTSIEPLYKKADIVIPLAALVGAPMCKLDPIGARTVNHDAVINMLSCLSNDQMLLMPTTNSAYGTGNDDNYCDETTELKPISQYAIDKVEVEQRVMQHNNAISFRLATVFGMSARMRTDLLVNDFTLKAFRDGFIGIFEGHFKRNFIHVRDVADVFLHGINNYELMKDNIFNVGLSNANITKLELCEKIKCQLPDFFYHEESSGKDPDQRNYIVSNSKIESTGFKPKRSIEDGIEELIKGYKMIKSHYFGNI